MPGVALFINSILAGYTLGHPDVFTPIREPCNFMVVTQFKQDESQM